MGPTANSSMNSVTTVDLTVPSTSAVPTSDVPVFSFTENDFIQQQSGINSAFDRLLKKQWTAASEAGVMKYNIVRHSLPSRLIKSTDYSLIASLIEGRAPGKRRQPEEMVSLRMPFDPKKFNFTKIESNELLFKLKCGDSEHSIIVNKSPIEYCSALLVPSLEQCMPQVSFFSLLTYSPQSL